MMEELMSLLREEGREARNLLAFHVSVDDDKFNRKPPCHPRTQEPRRSLKRVITSQQNHVGALMRSASTGRDKRSELRARYWALLFGNLQRAVGEIYNTVELHESMVECQETILVMENYIRDFRSLAEWFRVKWEYENTPAPQRPTSLAWEVRKASLPNSTHGDRVTPSPPLKQGRISPQNRQNLTKSPEGSIQSLSPQPEPIPEIDEKPKEFIPIVNVEPTEGKVPVTNESVFTILSPSEDQKTYLNVVKKTAVHCAEVGTITDEIFSSKTLTKKSNVVKVSQSCQTDEEVVESKLTSTTPPSQIPISKSNSKSDIKTRPTVTTTKSPYSTALLRTNPTKPTTKLNATSFKPISAPLRTTTPKILHKNPILPNKSLSKPEGQPKSPTSRLLRSKTSGDIKSKNSQSFTKQKSSLTIRSTLTTPKPNNKIIPFKNISRKNGPVSTPTTHRNIKKCDSNQTKPLENDKESMKNSNEIAKDENSINSSTETIVNTVLSGKSTATNGQPNVALDGWLTVKCRSRFKLAGKNGDRKPSSHWSNRFNEVSATASLPALALLQDSDSEPSQEVTKNNKREIYLRRTNTVLIRGYLKKKQEYNNEDEEEKKSAVVNVEKDEEKTETEEKCDEGGIDDVDQTDADDEMDKCESQDEEEHRRKTRQLNEEEAMLTQEIAELQSSTMDVDTETDGTETDGEIGDDEEDVIVTNQDEDISLEARYEPVLAGLSLGERMDTLAALEDLVARHPGRAMQLHQKLSNPLRRRSLPETLRRYQAKHARAEERRQALKQRQAVRLQALIARVEDVKAAKLKLIEKTRMRMENRHQRAQLNRTQHLKSVVRKAHDEEEKLREIAFIKELEAQNKRHDFLEQCREENGRLKDLREEQRKKIVEQAARGAAVEERRKAIEQARFDRLQRIQAERRLREERVGQRQLEIQEEARKKARGREERKTAMHAQKLASARELQKRISQKQEESARRHEENIEQIRQKALELSILRSHNEGPHTPALIPYELQKLCTVCNVHISSEVYLLSHLRGRSHQEAIRQATGPLVGNQLEQYELEHIVDAPVDDNHPRLIAARERVKTLRKRWKKLRQRMTSKGLQFETEHNQPKVDNASKRTLKKSAQKITSLMGQGWVSSSCTQLDRILGETNRILVNNRSNDLIAFQATGWFAVLSKLISLGMDVTTSPPTRSLITACKLWLLACKHGAIGAENCQYSVLSNHITVVMDLLHSKLQGLAKDDCLPAEPLATAAMQLLATVLKNVPDDIMPMRIQDVVSYAVCVGVVEQLAQCCVSVRGPVHDDTGACGFLLAALDLLTGLAKRCGPAPLDQQPAYNACNGNSGDHTSSSGSTGSIASIESSTSKASVDPTHFTAALHATELVGVVSMLYGILLPTGASPRCEGKPPGTMPSPCLALATAVCRLLRQVAELDLKQFQQALGAEGVSLQFRHIAGHLLWSCASPTCDDGGDVAKATEELLHEVIGVVGYFAIRHYDNQMLLVSGYAPSVLQQLCTLPFRYFSVPALSAILYPTLLACCCDNPETTQVLQQELNYDWLNQFRSSADGLKHPLIKLLNATATLVAPADSS